MAKANKKEETKPAGIPATIAANVDKIAKGENIPTDEKSAGDKEMFDGDVNAYALSAAEDLHHALEEIEKQHVAKTKEPHCAPVSAARQHLLALEANLNNHFNN